MRPRPEPRNDLVAREADAKEAFERAKLAKLTAEMAAIQQAGERKAGGSTAGDAVMGG